MRIAVGLGKKGGEERLAQQGVSRRDFLKFCTAVAVTMGLGPSMATEVAAALTNRRASVVYLHCAECTGCSEALLRTCKPFLDTLILDTISLDYHETIMAAAGEAAEAALALFAGGAESSNVPTCELTADDLVADARVTTMLVRANLCKSQSDARNQVKAGAVYLGDEKVEDFGAQVSAEQLQGDGILLKKGKKGFCRLILKA